MENNNSENKMHCFLRLEEQLMQIVLDINRLDYNKIRKILHIKTLFNEDKEKFYYKLRRDLEDIQTLIKFITEYNNLINNQKEIKNMTEKEIKNNKFNEWTETRDKNRIIELKEILKNITSSDYKFVFKKLFNVCLFKKIELIEDREKLYKIFINEFKQYELCDFVREYNNIDR
jgi:hypothetical protein